jgi:hypothetical protein
VQRVVAVMIAALALPGAAAAKGLPIVLDRDAAVPGDRVTASLGCTPPVWRPPPIPMGPRYEVFLLREGREPRVRVGAFRADLSFHGRTTFVVPELPAGTYHVAFKFGDNLWSSGELVEPRCERLRWTLTIVEPSGSRSPMLGVGAALLAGAAFLAVVLRRKT